MTQRPLFDLSPEPWEIDQLSDWLAARVVFPGPPHGPFDYLVPDALRPVVKPGARVTVPLGSSRRPRLGYCVELVQGTSDTARSIDARHLKPISTAIDPQPLVPGELLSLAGDISAYYLTPLGSVLESIVPPSVRMAAGTRKFMYVQLVPQALVEVDAATSGEVNAATSGEVNAATSGESLAPPRRRRLTAKQLQLVQLLERSARPLTAAQLAKAAGCTLAPIQALCRRGIVRLVAQRQFQREHEVPPEAPEVDLRLNADQQRALAAVQRQLERGQHATFLLHGITGSGKTEVYVRAIQTVIEFGRQAIVMVPEISLTPQTRQRFRARFPHVAVLHSHLSDAERHWHWQQIREGRVQVVVGARSAVFAPVPHLGLIVIDEEHDGSFKQDQAPRYHAREVARWRARRAGVPLVLGSATPSLESWQQGVDGQFTLIQLPQRVLDLPLPAIRTVDLRGEASKRTAGRGAISRPLHAEIRQAVNDGGQVILLLNRRGFSTAIQCPRCGHVAQCPHCAIALTHHRSGHRAVCHYCDFQSPLPNHCPECRFEAIRLSGFGTQRLEAEVRARFPDAECLRMDTDTMRRPGSHEAALARFRSGEVRILLGTQMIAKGLDFPDVTLVGVINADIALHMPDFRAAERAFALVTQVAGRSGRGARGGKVVVQTFSPEHPAIAAASRHHYTAFAQYELGQRVEHGFPPARRLARIVVRGVRQAATEAVADQWRGALHTAIQPHVPAVEVLGPAPAPVARLRDRYRYHLLVRCWPEFSLQPLLAQAAQSLSPHADVQWIVDVDPLDMQ